MALKQGTCNSLRGVIFTSLIVSLK